MCYRTTRTPTAELSAAYKQTKESELWVGDGAAEAISPRPDHQDYSYLRAASVCRMCRGVMAASLIHNCPPIPACRLSCEEFSYLAGHDCQSGNRHKLRDVKDPGRHIAVDAYSPRWHRDVQSSRNVSNRECDRLPLSAARNERVPLAGGGDAIYRARAAPMSWVLVTVRKRMAS